MYNGKHWVQHLSLPSVLVPLIKVRIRSCNNDNGQTIPKVPKSPGPKYKRFPLQVRCQYASSMLYFESNE